VNPSPHALIVEDLDFWQDALGEALAEAGYQVYIAASRAEALEALARHKFQLVVIDPVLDDTNRRNRDGLHVLQHILDEELDVCVVLVTSSDPNRIQRELREMAPDIPLFWKDEWEDECFLAVVRRLMSVKRGAWSVKRNANVAE
jgi:CheY-like chemotaxis protein